MAVKALTVDDRAFIDVVLRDIDPAARIICSALGQQRPIMHAIQLGAKGFITEPFQPPRVVSALKKALDIS